MTDEIHEARKYFIELGFDTIPLKEGEKVPSRHNWQTTSSYRLWKNAGGDANIGIRGGGAASVAFIDCDHEDTYSNTRDFMDGLGYAPGTYPVVQTASGSGRHIYTTLSGELPGQWRKLSPILGSGELRYGSGAFVVAPPSIVKKSNYSLIRGDYRVLPELTAADVLPILTNKNTEPEQAKPRMSRLASNLLAGGDALKRYETRSEAEMGLMASLINSGYNYAAILSLFDSNPCAGKYREMRATNPQLADHYFKTTYLNALDWCERHTSKPRKTAEQLQIWAQSRPWPGRTGITDRAVFIAHTQKAWVSCANEFHVSVRELAELAGIGAMTASRANKRLITDELLVKSKDASTDCATLYQFGDIALTNLNTKKEKWLSGTYPHSMYEDMYHLVTKQGLGELHDVFRHRGLGKSAGEIWLVLSDGEGKTAGELVNITGRHKRTIYRVLERLSGHGKRKVIDSLTGEVVVMVRKDGGKWFAVREVDLDHVAKLVRTYGALERQKREHAEDRRIHRRGLERRKVGL